MYKIAIPVHLNPCGLAEKFTVPRARAAKPNLPRLAYSNKCVPMGGDRVGEKDSHDFSRIPPVITNPATLDKL